MSSTQARVLRILVLCHEDAEQMVRYRELQALLARTFPKEDEPLVTFLRQNYRSAKSELDEDKVDAIIGLSEYNMDWLQTIAPSFQEVRMLVITKTNRKAAHGIRVVDPLTLTPAFLRSLLEG